MMKKEKQTGPRTAPPPYRIRVNAVSCGHRLVYETLDSIDEVWRSQDQKSELSCFFQKLPIRRNYPGVILPGLLFLNKPVFSCLRC
jgi:hypothetical protein